MRRVFLIPADVHQSAGLVARDLLREAGVTRCIEQARACRTAGDEVYLDIGDSGGTAPEIGRVVETLRPDTVEIWTVATHCRAHEVLRSALAERGFAPTSVVVGADGTAQHSADVVLLPTVPADTFEAAAGSSFALPAEVPIPIPAVLPSPFAPALHLGSRAWLAQLERFVAPHRRLEWQMLLMAHDALVQPVLEIYAGRALRDRNAELLVNIV